MAGDDVTITVRADNGDAVRAFRDTEGRLRGMRGRFVSEGSIMSGAMRGLSASIGSLIPAATAAVPAAAALGLVALKTAGAAAGAGVALGAFGAAVAGQVSSLSDASEAQTEYNDAVTQYGVGSKQAAEAQRAAQTTLAGMPAATARASVALGTLSDTFRGWSDDMAAFTMVPVERSFTLLGQLIPKLTPMVKGASAELDRLVTVAGGAIATPGFDALADKLSTFANEALKDAVDGIIHFTRVLSEGDANGPLKTFMEYAERNGPAVREALSAAGNAVSTLAQAAADAGPGMLTLVTAAAQLVGALPPELVATLMQAAVALKAVTLAGAGAAAIAGGITTLRTAIAGLAATSAAAGGGVLGLQAALATLSTKAKVGLTAAAIGGLVLALHELSDNKAPVAVDELSTSLNTLASTGKVTGVLKTNFDEITSSIAMMSKEASDNKFLQLTSDFGTWIGIATGPGISDARENLDAWDKSMANLVKAGNPEAAAAQFEILRKAWQAGGGDLERLKTFTTDYDNALADAKYEQDAATESMSVFGQAAQDTSAKLEAQKRNADALRQSIFALNDVNRSAHDAQTQFEESLDALTESFKEHGATLNEDTAAGQANRDVMSAVSAAHDEMVVTGVAANESFASMTKKSDKLRETMMRLATDAFGGNKKAAEEYVNTLLGTPESVKTAIELERRDAITGLEDVQREILETPGLKEVTVRTLNGAAIAALEAVGYKTEQLPDGKTRVFTDNGDAMADIRAVARAIAALNGKTATTYVKTVKLGGSSMYANKQVPAAAQGGLISRIPRYASGGDVQAFPDGGFVQGPGTGTSDSILALLGSGAMARISNTEYVVNARQTSKYLPLLEAINRDQLPRFAGGGLTGRRSAGVAGGGGPSVVELRSGGGAAADLVLELLRQAVKPRGGNVQLAVMGRP